MIIKLWSFSPYIEIIDGVSVNKSMYSDGAVIWDVTGWSPHQPNVGHYWPTEIWLVMAETCTNLLPFGCFIESVFYSKIQSTCLLWIVPFIFNILYHVQYLRFKGPSMLPSILPYHVYWNFKTFLMEHIILFLLN